MLEAPPVLRRRDTHRAATEVVLADGHTLRASRRARRVRHDGGPSVADGLGRLDLALLGRVRERSLVVAALAHDEPRHVGHTGERRLEILGDDDRRRARVVDDPPRLVRLEVDVHRHDDRAEATTSVHRLEELERVGDHHRHPVAAPHAEPRERVRHPAGAVVELGVGPGLFPLTQRHVVGTGPGVGDQSGVVHGRALVAGC